MIFIVIFIQRHIYFSLLKDKNEIDFLLHKEKRDNNNRIKNWNQDSIKVTSTVTYLKTKKNSNLNVCTGAYPLISINNVAFILYSRQVFNSIDFYAWKRWTTLTYVQVKCFYIDLSTKEVERNLTICWKIKTLLME